MYTQQHEVNINMINPDVLYQPQQHLANNTILNNDEYTTMMVEHLNDFSEHQLSDLKNASLMDRVDTKFLIPLTHLPTLLEAMKGHYSALDIDGKRIFTYHNTYFDTENYLFYHMHHQGKLNRFKVRHRFYTDTQTGFLEVKFKNNKGRTIKSRIPCLEPSLDKNGFEFLAEKLGQNFPALQATQWGSYQRIALAQEASGERLTIDMNLCFEALEGQFSSKEFKDAGSSIELPKMFIAELKQNQHNPNSAFAMLMAKLNIRPLTFSKYCIGCSLVNPSLKANRFKQQILTLKKFH